MGQITEPFFYIKFSAPLDFRITDGDTQDYDSETYTEADFNLSQFSWENNQMNPVTITFQAIDQTYQAIFQGVDAAECPCEIIISDKSTPTLGKTLMIGFVSDIDMDGNTVNVVIDRMRYLSPNKYADEDSGFTYMDGPGTYIFPLGSVVIRRDDGRYNN
jgi:hypothetical protein